MLELAVRHKDSRKLNQLTLWLRLDAFHGHQLDALAPVLGGVVDLQCELRTPMIRKLRLEIKGSDEGI